MNSYAVTEKNSRARAIAEPKSPLRNDFQRDRDRIIHSAAFRRLMYKTQVFVNHEGDMFRTRLSHSLEVAQISRGISRSMEINEDLAETIALAHDLGHTPFGHAGQDALNHCMKNYGGFEHNLQSLRVVDLLEKRYANFDGLNLTFESREGILKHCSLKNARLLGELGQRFIEKKQTSLEAQVVDLSDAIAYNMHDLDDGYRSNILDLDSLNEIEFFSECHDEVVSSGLIKDQQIVVNETIRLMTYRLIDDVTKTSLELIKTNKISDIKDVRNFGKNLVQFSEPLDIKLKGCQKKLRESLYTHNRIEMMSKKAHSVIESLFNYYINKTELVPDNYLIADNIERSVADYIAGMTDRFALKIFETIEK